MKPSDKALERDKAAAAAARLGLQQTCWEDDDVQVIEAFTEGPLFVVCGVQSRDGAGDRVDAAGIAAAVQRVRARAAARKKAAS